MLIAPLLLACATTLPQENHAPQLLTHAELHESLKQLASAHADLVSVIAVGRSRAGREIEGLRILSGERSSGRPAILVVADVDGPYVWTSTLALDEARALAEGYAKDERVKKLLDTTTVYVIPRADPDAAEGRFAKPLVEQWASGAGVDNDRDGRQGEDPPSDVDGDGFVTQIRVPDPAGEWIEDPTDARALVKADPKKGQHGKWKLWTEGRDLDRDKLVAEDAELDAIVNLNFPQGWRELDARAGRFATDEPPARALCDFVLLHKDVSLVLTYGAQDNLVEKPKTIGDGSQRTQRLPPDGTIDSDGELYAEIGKRYKKITGSKAKGENDTRGSFQSWCELQRGLWCLNAACWTMPLDEPAPKKEGEAEKPKPEGDAPEPSEDAKRLRWIDAHNEGARFVAWKPFQHPELGAVEIGGFAPYAKIEPPESERAEIAKKQFEFLVTLGELLPRVTVADCTAKSLSGGLWEVKAVLENHSYLPLCSAASQRANAVRPARVDLRLPKDAQLLGGSSMTLVEDLPGVRGRKEFRWLVHGAVPKAIGVEVDTDHAGHVQALPEVK
jgi:Zinc carboxypeptidase